MKQKIDNGDPNNRHLDPGMENQFSSGNPMPMNNEELKVAISDIIWEYELGKIGFGECVNKFSQFILQREIKLEKKIRYEYQGGWTVMD